MKRDLHTHTYMRFAGFFLFAVLITLMPQILLAATYDTGNPVYIVTQDCSGYSNPSSSKFIDRGILTPLIYCMTDVVNVLITAYLSVIAPQLRGACVVLCAIAISMLGVRIALGTHPAGQAKNDFIVLTLKICCINFFVFQYGIIEYVGLVNKIGNAVADAAFRSLVAAGMNPFSADIINSQSFANPTGTLSGGPTPPTGRAAALVTGTLPVPGGIVWRLMDDIILRIFGFLTSASGLATAFIGIGLIIVGLLYTGHIGAWITMMIISTFFSLIVALTLPLYVYVTTMIGTMILISVAPVIVPLILFKNAYGMDIFQAWVRQLISFAMQPMFLSLFLVFALNVMGGVYIDLTSLFKDADKTFNDRNVKNSVQIIGVDEAKNECAKESRRTSVFGAIYKYSGLKWVVGKVKKVIGKIVRGVLSLFVDMTALMWLFDRIIEFMVILLIGYLLLMMMITFQKQLPGMVTELVAEGDKKLTNFAQEGAKTVQGMSNKLQGAIASRSALNKSGGGGEGGGAGGAVRKVGESLKGGGGGGGAA
ncbi:MAG: hypothetical protein EB060_08995 [Proteobacteria bacterium]|nr:hypothetical protein [Pseudomonadota bacterium]